MSQGHRSSQASWFKLNDHQENTDVHVLETSFFGKPVNLFFVQCSVCFFCNSLSYFSSPTIIWIDVIVAMMAIIFGRIAVVDAGVIFNESSARIFIVAECKWFKYVLLYPLSLSPPPSQHLFALIAGLEFDDPVSGFKSRDRRMVSRNRIHCWIFVPKWERNSLRTKCILMRTYLSSLAWIDHFYFPTLPSNPSSKNVAFS